MGVPDRVFRVTVGSCSTLAISERVSDSTAASWRSSSPREPAREAVELGLSEVLGPAAQRADQGGDRAGRHLASVAVDLLGHDALDRVDLAGAAVDAGLGEGPQVVDVEQGDAGQVGDAGVDVAGHGHVDHEQRGGGATFDHGGQVVARHDHLR